MTAVHSRVTVEGAGAAEAVGSCASSGDQLETRNRRSNTRERNPPAIVIVVRAPYGRLDILA